jgi:hypothetical protein
VRAARTVTTTAASSRVTTTAMRTEPTSSIHRVMSVDQPVTRSVMPDDGTSPGSTRWVRSSSQPYQAT